MVILGDSESSLLISAVSYELDDLKMPPDARLSRAEQDILIRWIRLDVPWADELEGVIADTSGWDEGRIAEVRGLHWACRPV